MNRYLCSKFPGTESTRSTVPNVLLYFSEFSLDLECRPGDLENLPLKFVRDTDEVLKHALLELSSPPGTML